MLAAGGQARVQLKFTDIYVLSLFRDCYLLEYIRHQVITQLNGH